MTGTAGPLASAAAIFLEGSEPAPSQRRPVGIRDEAVDRVTSALEQCDADDLLTIVEAVSLYRQRGSWRAREAVIEAVTVAAEPIACRRIE